MFVQVSNRFPKFACSYFEKIVELIGRLESENAKKYLKCASDLLGIDDAKKEERALKIRNKFS